MPTFIVKPNRYEDFYVFWSTVVDAPTGFGTRAELVAACPPDRSVTERLDRADERGTSMIDGTWYGWDDDEWLVREGVPRPPGPGYWTVSRANVRALCEALSDDADPTAHLTFHPEDGA